MNYGYIVTETAWTEQAPPRAERASVSISAWTTDAEIATSAAELTAVYGNEYEIDTALRLVRSELRAAVLANADA